MNWLLLWLHLLALATWLGQTIFFGAVVAPALFGGLDREQAGNTVALIFPGYYAVGYGCGALLVITAVWLWRRARPAGGVWAIVAVISTAMLAAGLLAGLYVLPEIDVLRPLLHDAAAAASAQARFDALHRLSVQLNTVVLVGGVIVAGLLAWRLSTVEVRRRASRYASDPLL